MVTAVTPQVAPSIQIIHRRSTCVGIQYTIEDTLGTHTVTVNNACLSCSCGLEKYFVICPHRRVVETQERVYAEEAQKRISYCELFQIDGERECA